MVITPHPLSAWLGGTPPLWLSVIGTGLILFAADLIHQATRPRLSVWRAWAACIGDALWVAGSAVLIVAWPELWSPLGVALLSGVALVVGTFAVWQYRGIGQTYLNIETGLHRHCLRVAADAPADALWDVIARLGEIKAYMPTLRRSRLRDNAQPGIGAIRECEDLSGRRWAEECTAFEPGKNFTVRFLTEAPGFPFPAKTMVGGWSVEPAARGTSVVTVWWELDPKPRLLAPLLMPILACRADRDLLAVVSRMTIAASTTATRPAKESTTLSPLTRLLPGWC